MMKPARPHVLTIGGFDPTGGAGVLADIKTAERLRCYGMSVLTANTVQREDKVLSVNWLSHAYIKEQCDTLKQVDFKAIKIGIVQNVYGGTEQGTILCHKLNVKKSRGQTTTNIADIISIKTGQPQILIKATIVNQIGMKTYLPVLVYTEVARIAQGGLGLCNRNKK